MWPHGPKHTPGFYADAQILTSSQIFAATSTLNRHLKCHMRKSELWTFSPNVLFSKVFCFSKPVIHSLPQALQHRARISLPTWKP